MYYSHTKKHKLYNKSLDKLSLEIELSVSDPFGNDEPAPVPILVRHANIGPKFLLIFFFHVYFLFN